MPFNASGQCQNKNSNASIVHQKFILILSRVFCRAARMTLYFKWSPPRFLLRWVWDRSEHRTTFRSTKRCSESECSFSSSECIPTVGIIFKKNNGNETTEIWWCWTFLIKHLLRMYTHKLPVSRARTQQTNYWTFQWLKGQTFFKFLKAIIRSALR